MPVPRTPDPSAPAPSRLVLLRDLAARGRLSRACDDPALLTELRCAAYDLVWPLVWIRHTRRIEKAKGHARCASSFGRMDGPCLDGFHDDVESVLDYLFGYAKKPIHNLEGWITSRIAAAVVDGHRRRRGGRGALQRVRVPGWLRDRLDGDPWLVELAARVIEWVGVPTAAGTDLWPLDAWSEMRSTATGDRIGSHPAQVTVDLRRVLGAMRSRPSWFASYIERPLGGKQTPVRAAPDGGDPDLAGTGADGTAEEEARLAALARSAVDAISAGLADGLAPQDVVPAVVRTMFLHAGGTGADRDRWLASVLADERAVAELVRRILDVVRR